MRLQVGRVDHDCQVIESAGGRNIHHPGKDPHGAPTFLTIVERLTRAILLRSIPPAQPVAVHEVDPA